MDANPGCPLRHAGLRKISRGPRLIYANSAADTFLFTSAFIPPVCCTSGLEFPPVILPRLYIQLKKTWKCILYFYRTLTVSDGLAIIVEQTSSCLISTFMPVLYVYNRLHCVHRIWIVRFAENEMGLRIGEKCPLTPHTHTQRLKNRASNFRPTAIFTRTERYRSSDIVESVVFVNLSGLVSFSNCRWKDINGNELSTLQRS